MRIAWLAPYPVSLLRESLALSREGSPRHACSWILHLSRALSERDDVDLHLVILTAWVPYDQVISVGNITFHVLKNGIPFIHRGFPAWLPLDMLTGFNGDVRRLARAIARINPEVVHAHGTEAAYALGGLGSGYPCLISIQGIITEYQKTNPCFRFRVLSKREQEQVQRGKYFGCRTHFDDAFVRRVNPRATIFELQEAIDPIFFQQQWRAPDGAGILFVGSLEERKGAQFLIDALALLKRSVPAATLTLIGNGTASYVEHLKARARELGILNDVIFRGHVRAEDIAREHLKAQIFVLPTLNDNSPNTLGEAMVSGMPVVASAVGGVPSMVNDGQTGLLSPSADSKTLAEKIAYLLTHKAEREALGHNASRVGRVRHKPERVAEETFAAYVKILDLERGTTVATQTASK
jgi:glycosyltransferase involved in cell wall biosynthesis